MVRLSVVISYGVTELIVNWPDPGQRMSEGVVVFKTTLRVTTISVLFNYYRSIYD